MACNNKPRVSIITGIYNCAETLPEALDSILNQTFTDWKMIMCDDGSSDDTLTVANEYKCRFPDKFVVIQNEKNMGLNYTLNRCLEYADTQYVARMDGDDISLPERLEKEVTFLDENLDYAFVSTPMIYFDEDGEFRRGKGHGEPKLENFAKFSPFCHAPCMVRKEAYEAVGGYSKRKNRLRVEDWDMWIRMYEIGLKGFVLTEPYYMMRDDRNAISRRKFKYRVNEALVVFSAVKKLGLSKKYYLFGLKPIIVGLLPKRLYKILHSRKVKS